MEEFKKRLSDNDYILIRYERKGGEIPYMLLVYYSRINEEEYQLFRVDMSHGFLHKDKLFEARRDRIKEQIFEKPTVELVWEIVDETKENWQEMKRKFIENLEAKNEVQKS